jgi:hypothetical protein
MQFLYNCHEVLRFFISCSVVLRGPDNCIVLVTSSLNPSQLVNLFTSVGLASFLIIVSLSVGIIPEWSELNPYSFSMSI